MGNDKRGPPKQCLALWWSTASSDSLNRLKQEEDV